MDLVPKEEIFGHGVSASRIGTWACRRKFYNRYVRGLDVPHISTAITFGKAMDEVWNEYFSGTLDEKGCIEMFQRIYQDREDDSRRTTERGVFLLKLYFKTFPRESDPFEVIEVQEPFLLDIGAAAPFCGKPDLIVKDKATGDYIPFDNKTTSQFGDTFQDKFDIDTGTEGYIAYTEDKFGSSFRARFNVMVAQKTKPRVERFDINKSKEQIKYWRERTKVVIDEMVEHVDKYYDDPERFVMIDSQCTSYNSRCQYWDLCKYCDKLSVVEGDFVQRVYDPFKK